MKSVGVPGLFRFILDGWFLCFCLFGAQLVLGLGDSERASLALCDCATWWYS